MSDQPSSPSELAFMLGRIQGDVKHILEALMRNQEQFTRVDDRFSHFEDRLDKVERFNVKVLTAASIAGPVLMVLLNVALKFIGL